MTTTLFAMLSQGAHVVVTDDSYRRTRQFLNQTLRRYGVEVSTVPAGDYEPLEEAIRRRPGSSSASRRPTPTTASSTSSASPTSAGATA